MKTVKQEKGLVDLGDSRLETRGVDVEGHLEGAEAVQRTNTPAVKLLVDIFHMLRNGESPDDILKVGPLIRHAHLAENRRVGFLLAERLDGAGLKLALGIAARGVADDALGAEISIDPEVIVNRNRHRDRLSRTIRTYSWGRLPWLAVFKIN